MIFACNDLKGITDPEGNADVGREYEGYYIVLPMDPRAVAADMYTEHYKAKIHPTSEDVFISFPAWPYDRLDFEECDEVGVSLMKGIDSARDDYRKDTGDKGRNQERKWKHYMIRFQGDSLSAKVLHDEAGEDHELETKFIYSHKYVNGKKSGEASFFACWSVANIKKKSYKRGDTTVTEKKESKNMAMLRKILAKEGF